MSPERRIETRESPLLKQAVVAFLERDGHILLAKKKAKIGVDQWNGYGGIREEGDATIEDTLHREVSEETKQAVSTTGATLQKIGIVTYHNPLKDDRRKVVEVHFFIVSGWSGSLPKENDEMGPPQWFPANAFPYSKMMASDKLWLPEALKGERLIMGTVFYGPTWEVERSHFAPRPTEPTYLRG